MDGRNITKIVRNMMLYKNKTQKVNLNNNEFELVRYLTKHKTGLFLKDIADYLNVDKSLVTRMAKKLEAEEYIMLENDRIDSRKKIAKPLDKAFMLKAEVRNEEIEFYNAILKVLDDGEQEILDKLIYKIYIESKRLRKNKFEGVISEKVKLQ